MTLADKLLLACNQDISEAYGGIPVLATAQTEFIIPNGPIEQPKIQQKKNPCTNLIEDFTFNGHLRNAIISIRDEGSVCGAYIDRG
mmetsp:Transcript_4387/g.8449  ORF Transcript_4387/g.8449 Transcript_4387/m.8449 type:complete len:86 (+) Transcript_4387:248-505(+)